MREGQDHLEPVLSRPQAIAVADQHSHLNRAQKTVIEDVLSSPRSHSRNPRLRRLRQDDHAHRHPQRRGRAGLPGRGLRPDLPRCAATERGGNRSRNPARLPRPHSKSRCYENKSTSTLSMNRVSPARTRCASFLPGLVPHDRGLLPIGDIRQHQGVEAVGSFEQLQKAGMRTGRLDEIVRQQDPALKSAVDLLADGPSFCCARRTPTAGPCEGNSQPGRAHPRHC